MCFHWSWPCLLCPLAAACPLPLPPPLLCSITASPCSCCKPLIGTTLTTGCWWNSLLLFIKQKQKNKKQRNIIDNTRMLQTQIKSMKVQMELVQLKRKLTVAIMSRPCNPADVLDLPFLSCDHTLLNFSLTDLIFSQLSVEPTDVIKSVTNQNHNQDKFTKTISA